MKIKRYEFGVNVLVLILFAITAAVSLISAYGAACVAFDQTYWARQILGPSPPFPPGYVMTIMFEYMGTFGYLFQALNIVTWVTSFITAFMLFAYLTGFLGKWIRYVAIINALIAFLAGLIPALIADTNGFSFMSWDSATQGYLPFVYESIGSPHWAKTIANATVLGVLALIMFFDLIKVTNFKSFNEKDNRFSGNVGRQLMLVSIILFWLSAVSFLGTSFMADAHVVGGINVWELIEIQSIGGYVTLFSGVSALSAGLIYNKIRPSTLVK
jgi:hypothetical protein